MMVAAALVQACHVDRAPPRQLSRFPERRVCFVIRSDHVSVLAGNRAIAGMKVVSHLECRFDPDVGRKGGVHRAAATQPSTFAGFAHRRPVRERARRHRCARRRALQRASGTSGVTRPPERPVRFSHQVVAATPRSAPRRTAAQVARSVTSCPKLPPHGIGGKRGRRD